MPSDKFELSYLVDFNHPDLKQRWVSFDYENVKDVIEARTFGYLADLEKLQAMGLAQGVSLENTLGLKDDGGYTSDLRSEFEPAKHKMLDLIGDFYLSGVNPFNMNIRLLLKAFKDRTLVLIFLCAGRIADHTGKGGGFFQREGDLICSRCASQHSDRNGSC